MTAAKPSGAAPVAFTRKQVWKLLGEPMDQVGSVNDPRTHVECGVKWNEKWVYPNAHADGALRVVLWNRYDLLGVFAVRPDGSAVPEPLPG